MTTNTTSMEVRQQLRKLLAQIDMDEALRRRSVQSAISYALAGQFRCRAEVFEWAAPQPGDFTGRATPAELAEATQRCRATAVACRRRAELLDREAGDD